MSWVGENGEIWGRWLRRGPAMIYGEGKLFQLRFLLFTLIIIILLLAPPLPPSHLPPHHPSLL